MLGRDLPTTGLESAEELCHSPQWGSTVRSLVNRPMGIFAWANPIYYQITQPGSSTVTPLYHRSGSVLEAAESCSPYIGLASLIVPFSEARSSEWLRAADDDTVVSYF